MVKGYERGARSLAFRAVNRLDKPALLELPIGAVKSTRNLVAQLCDSGYRGAWEEPLQLIDEVLAERSAESPPEESR